MKKFVVGIVCLLGVTGSVFGEGDAAGFVHPGLLHTAGDFARVKEKLAAHEQPWEAGWKRLVANKHCSLNWKPRAVEVVWRGTSKGHHENYPLLYNDIAAAYQCGLRWRITGDRAYGEKAVEILNAWSSTLKKIDGTSDRFLASGIYGYEMANAGELMRGFDGWKAEDFEKFQEMMRQKFYSMNHDFLAHHNGAKIDHYWNNWDACNMASVIGIGILCDDRQMFEEGVEYYKHGAGNGGIEKAVWVLYPAQNGETLGQWQESGRDQGHSTLGISLMGAVCQEAWNQGVDLFGYDDNRFLKGAEYVAKYNLGEEVPYTLYKNSDVTQPVISEHSRGDERPSWELVYNHYVVLKGLKARWVEKFAAKVRPEGGGGDYGPNSGGYDQLGEGTLMYTLRE
ncbi:MAG: alginate lyase family protein [Phycisphaerae bacterium]